MIEFNLWQIHQDEQKNAWRVCNCKFEYFPCVWKVFTSHFLFSFSYWIRWRGHVKCGAKDLLANCSQSKFCSENRFKILKKKTIDSSLNIARLVCRLWNVPASGANRLTVKLVEWCERIACAFVCVRRNDSSVGGIIFRFVENVFEQNELNLIVVDRLRLWYASIQRCACDSPHFMRWYSFRHLSVYVVTVLARSKLQCVIWWTKRTALSNFIFVEIRLAIRYLSV